MFDGDVLNIMLIINKEFYQRASETFNPRNAVFISKNDGMFKNATNHQRETIINTHTMIKLSRNNYSKENLEKIYDIVKRNK